MKYNIAACIINYIPRSVVASDTGYAPILKIDTRHGPPPPPAPHQGTDLF